MKTLTYIGDRPDGWIIFSDTQCIEDGDPNTVLAVSPSFNEGYYLHDRNGPVDEAWNTDREDRIEIARALRGVTRASIVKPSWEVALKACRNLNINWFEAHFKSAGQVRAVESVASHLFRGNIQGPDVEIIRMCLNELDKEGCLPYSEDSTSEEPTGNEPELFAVDETANSGGTHLQTYFTTSYAKLKKLFGDATGCDDHKVSSEWVFKSVTGAVVTLYDYKATGLYDATNLPSVEQFRRKRSYDWHIGAKDRKTADAFAAWLTEKLGG